MKPSNRIDLWQANKRDQSPPRRHGGVGQRLETTGLFGHDDQEVAGPLLAELVARQFPDASSGIGNHDRMFPDTLEHNKVAESVFRGHVGNGGHRYVGQGLIGPFDRFG